MEASLNKNRRRSCLPVVTVFTLILGMTSLSFASDPAINWLKIPRATSPSGRGAMAMVYDGVSKKVILFGGFGATSYLNDTWTWDGVKWTQIATAIAPSPRAASGVGFDRVTGKVVLFGGFDGTNYLGDTWLWDGATYTWTQANPSTNPTAVTLPMLFNDPLSGRIDQFGGFDGFLYQDITWRWTGTDWVQVRTSTIPYARGAGTAVYDPVHKNVVLWGGLADLNPLNTWTFDGTNWTEQFPVTQPDITYYLGSTYDPSLQQVIITGGFDSANLSETWVWTGSDWLKLVPQITPPGRVSLGLAYDEASQQLIMFGGQNSTTLLNGTWKLVKR
jgi:hypothetical protein